MTLDRYIQRDTQVIKTDDQLNSGLKKLEREDTLPLLQDGKYLGIINRDNLDLLQKSENGFEIEDTVLYRPYISNLKSELEAIKLLNSIPIDYLPVTDMEGNFLGVWNQKSNLQFYMQSEAMRSEGSAVTLEIETQNYTLSEIAQIAESSSKRILGVDVHFNSENETLMVSIFLDEKNIGDFISSLERYGYNIHTIVGYENNNDKLRDNYDALLSYLDI